MMIIIIMLTANVKFKKISCVSQNTFFVNKIF